MTNEQAIIELRDLISDDNTDRENEALLLAIETLRDRKALEDYHEALKEDYYKALKREDLENASEC